MWRKISKIYFCFSYALQFYSKLTAKIRFIVKREVSGGVNFKLLPVTIKLGGQVRDVTTQEIIAEFKN